MAGGARSLVADGLLTTAGRRKTTLSAIPVHVSICCSLSPWAIREIDRRRRAFVWAGTDTVSGGRCRVAWTVACSPRDLGGLGLPDLRTLGFALRLRWEWQRRSDVDAPWALLPSRAEKAVAAMFSASVSVQVGDGTRTLFWTDSWLPDGPIERSAPTLFARVGHRRRRRTVKDALTAHRWVRDIAGARTQPVMLAILDPADKLAGVHLTPGLDDRFIWKWTASGDYSSASAYRAFFAGTTELLGARELWKTRAPPPKVKFFFWLGLHGRLWTSERRARHGLQQSPTCVLCDQLDETHDHLLAECVYTREVWLCILSTFALGHLTPTADDTLLEWWLRTRARFHDDLQKAFDTLVLLVSWMLWKERNRRVFDDDPSPATTLLDRVKEEADSWIAAGFRSLAAFASLVP